MKKTEPDDMQIDNIIRQIYNSFAKKLGVKIEITKKEGNEQHEIKKTN